MTLLSAPGLHRRERPAGRRPLTLPAPRRSTARVAVLAVAVDNADEIADALGAEVLAELCSRLARRVRRMPEPVRVVEQSGPGFLTLRLVSADAREEERLVDIVHRALSRPVQATDERLWPVISLGVRSGTRSTPADLLAADARTALSAARAEGAGHVQWFDPQVRSSACRRLRTTGELVGALDRGDQLVLHYQPVYDLTAGTVVAAEALVRWQHPERGLLSPAEFVPLAEQAGLIGRLGEAVLEQALAQAARWRAQGLADLRVHVNVSAAEFRQPGYVQTVVAALARHQVPAGMLLLEITETGLMTGSRHVVETLHRLRAAGIGLGIDDFGTGYSSISYLHELPVDTVKLDRSLIAGIASSPQEFALARAVLGLLETRPVRVQAEGVETAVQVAHLRALQCRYGQGYHLARPMSADQLTALLTDQVSSVGVSPVRGSAPAVPLRPAGSALLEPAAERLEVAG